MTRTGRRLVTVVAVAAQAVGTRTAGWSWPRSDWTLPIVLAAVSQPDVWAPASYNLGHLVGPRPVVALLYVVTSLALVWRRRFPLVVLAFIVTADAVEYLAFGAPEGLGSLLPTVAAFYAVGRYAPRTAVSAAAPLALLGIVVHELTDPVYVFGGSNGVFYAVVAAAWPLGQAFQRRAEHALSLQRESAQLAAERARAAEQATAAERARIARELHDVVGHGLSVVVLQLVGASALLDKGHTTETREQLAASEHSARQALTEMRRLLDLLREGDDTYSLTPQPGLRDLDQLVADTRRAGATVTLRITGAPLTLPPGLDLTAYRILQETLTNVLKHSRPPICTIELDYDTAGLTIEVADHGEPTSGSGDGRGLTGMRERVAIFHGTLSAGPDRPCGFRVRAWLPVPG